MRPHPAAPMTIRLELPEDIAPYFNHARAETMREAGCDPGGGPLDPAPFGMYLVARDRQGIVGLAEFCFFDQVYSSFADAYCPERVPLASYGPFGQFVGTRTIFVEPSARRRMPPVFLMLALAGCRLASSLGARFTTATTSAANRGLLGLYRKTGGELVGTLRDVEGVPCEIAVLVFQLANVMSHPAMARLDGMVEVDPEIAKEIRQRSARDAWRGRGGAREGQGGPRGGAVGAPRGRR